MAVHFCFQTKGFAVFLPNNEIRIFVLVRSVLSHVIVMTNAMIYFDNRVVEEFASQVFSDFPLIKLLGHLELTRAFFPGYHSLTGHLPSFQAAAIRYVQRYVLYKH